MLIQVFLLTLEPGNHIARKTIDRRLHSEHEIPDAECQEVRPDWGEYLPLTTFPAIERALKRRNAFPVTRDNECCQYGIKK